MVGASCLDRPGGSGAFPLNLPDRRHRRRADGRPDAAQKASTRCYITHCVIFTDCGATRRVITRIFKNSWFERFARKERLSDAVLAEAIARAENGLIDADLGGGVIKQRVARTGQGKSGGYRTLILFRQGDRAVFAFGFGKARQANISKADLAMLRDAAREALGWSDDDVERLVTSGALTEIEHGQDGER